MRLIVEFSLVVFFVLLALFVSFVLMGFPS